MEARLEKICIDPTPSVGIYGRAAIRFSDKRRLDVITDIHPLEAAAGRRRVRDVAGECLCELGQRLAALEGMKTPLTEWAVMTDQEIERACRDLPYNQEEG